MGRPTKDSKALNLRLASEVCDRLEGYCKETGITKNNSY